MRAPFTGCWKRDVCAGWIGGGDVRSICEYIENPRQANFVVKAKNTRPRNTMRESDFFADARQGRWASRR